MTSWIWIYLSCDSTSFCIITWCPMVRSFLSYGQEQWHSGNYFSAMAISLQLMSGSCFRTQEVSAVTPKIPHTTVIYCGYHQYTWSSYKGRSGLVKNIYELMELMNGRDGGKKKTTTERRVPWLLHWGLERLHIASLSTIHHGICQVIWPKQQGSLNLLQNPLLLWTSFKNSSNLYLITQ